ncbi:MULTISPECIES: hypothetical protein [unclassified Roseofilum]|nr:MULTISPECIES: hypothetical protein [unclassified Roseofilum]
MDVEVYKVLLLREEWLRFPAIPDIELQMKQVAEKQRIRLSDLY